MGEKKPLEKPELSTTSSTTVVPKNGLREYYFGTMASQPFLKPLSAEFTMKYAACKERPLTTSKILSPDHSFFVRAVFFWWSDLLGSLREFKLRPQTPRFPIVFAECGSLALRTQRVQIGQEYK